MPAMESKKASMLAALLEDDSDMPTGPLQNPPLPFRTDRSHGIRSGDVTLPGFDLEDGLSPRSTTSCVTQQTIQEDCSRHRFIVWAATQRNASPGMMPEKRLECPLLRCTRRFPDHETMLRHLARCTYLASGEYWCYDHQTIEHFDDIKCKRCLGHPSKRKKVLNLAKRFFHSLGHKPRKGLTPGYDATDNPFQPPPSYDSLLVPASVGNATELPSQGIVEIDSTEISGNLNQPTFDLADAVVNPQDLQAPPCVPGLPELDSVVPPAGPYDMQWEQHTMFTPSNFPLGFEECDDRGAIMKPILQVNTHSLPGRRYAPRPLPREVPVVPRGKGLSPSSSVRSTASTDTTASTNSNVSSLVSPSSNWSGIWSSPSGQNTTLTSPVEAKEDPWAAPHWSVHNFFSELPADMPAVPESEEVVQPAPALPFQDAQPDILLPTATTILEPSGGVAVIDENEGSVMEEMDSCSSPTRSVVSLGLEALQEHLVCSTLKIQHIQGNHLADQLRTLSPATIAKMGLKSLRAFLNGGHPSSAIDALCFVHLMYAFSLAVHEKGMPAKFKPFFLQSLSYVNLLPAADQNAYTELTLAIWQPPDVGERDVASLLVIASSRRKGKGVDVGPDDVLLNAARDFLDELEISLIGQGSSSSEFQTSELFNRHLGDLKSASQINFAFLASIRYVLDTVTRDFEDDGALSESLKKVYQRAGDGAISSVRRAEVEILSAGKKSMPHARFFDEYTPTVRGLCNGIYVQHDGGTTRRDTYHLAGISLIEQLIPELDQPAGQPLLDDHDELEDFIKRLTTDYGEETVSALPESFGGSFSGAQSTETGYLDAIAIPSAGSPSRVLEAAGEGQQGGNEASEQQNDKVEADSCCDICGYRPKGDPQWFKGSMAKHKKTMHSANPPKIYKCPYPGCTSQYRNRQDNLRQHQIEKGHWVDGEEAVTHRRPSKRKKLETEE